MFRYFFCFRYCLLYFIHRTPTLQNSSGVICRSLRQRRAAADRRRSTAQKKQFIILFSTRIPLWAERCHNIRGSGIENSSERGSSQVEIFQCFWCNEIDTQVRGYREKLRFFSAFNVTRWIPSHMGIHGVTPKALKNLNL